MAIESTNKVDKIDVVAVQVELAKEAGKEAAVEQAEKATDKYHDRLTEEEILMGSGDVFERSNAQRLAAIVAEKGRV